MDDLNAEVSGQHNPRCANYWAALTRKWHHKEHRPRRPSGSSDPTQHAKGRVGDCPRPCKETATIRNVIQRGGGRRGSEAHGGGGRLRGSWDANYPCPPPPPPLGAFGQQLVAKGVALRRHGRLRRPMLHEHQRCPKENLVQFAPQHYP